MIVPFIRPDEFVVTAMSAPEPDTFKGLTSMDVLPSGPASTISNSSMTPVKVLLLAKLVTPLRVLPGKLDIRSWLADFLTITAVVPGVISPA